MRCPRRFVLRCPEDYDGDSDVPTSSVCPSSAKRKSFRPPGCRAAGLGLRMAMIAASACGAALG